MQTSRKKNIKINKWLIIAVAVFLLGALTFWATFSILKKPKAEHEVKKAIDSISIMGESPVWSETRDNGCFTNDAGWLGATTSCAYAGEKFYKGVGNPSADLKRLDEVLTTLGWQRQGNLPESAELNDKVWINYTNPAKGLPGATLTFISEKSIPSGTQYTPSQILQNISQSAEISGDEYLYGVSVYYNY